MFLNCLVSIIIPTYNRAHLIGETLDSILAQTYTNWECIIVDDGSNDNTAEVVKSYGNKDKRIQFVPRPSHYLPGANGARNYGLEICKGTYINWFDDDDWMHPEKLEIQLNALQNSDYDFSICQTSVFEGNPQHITGLRHDKIFSATPVKDFVKREIVFLTQSPLIKKDFLTRYNIKFDEELLAAQDWDFNFRCLINTKNIHVTEKALVSIRKHPDNISSSSEFEDIRMWHYYLARVKVYKICKKEGLLNDTGLRQYFKEYFSRFFVKYIKQQNRKKSCEVYSTVLKDFFSFYDNLKLRFYLFMVLIFGFRHRLKKRILQLL